VSPRTHALSSCARALVLVEVLTGPGLLQVGAPAAPAEPLGEAEQPPWALRRAQRAALIHKRSTRQRGGELNAVVGAVVSAVLERIGDTDSEGRVIHRTSAASAVTRIVSKPGAHRNTRATIPRVMFL